MYGALANLELVRDSSAAAAPGKGVTIGLIDTGIHADHDAFGLTTGSIEEEFRLGATDEPPHKSSHGTAVAGIAAGRYGAYGAKIKMFAIPLGSGGGTYTPISLGGLSATDGQHASLFNHVLGKDLDILNLSFAFSGCIERYTKEQLHTNYGRTIQALAQSGEQEKTILVWAAGNAGNKINTESSSPEILAGLVARINELQSHSIAVVSVGEDGDISSFSNRCGIAKDFCIAAPGESMVVADRKGTPTGPKDNLGEAQESWLWKVQSGTSLAAPMVSGGLAVMKQLFRNQLSNTELVSRLFTTAKDDGIYANAATYGHGLLDLGAATNPWGTPGFMETSQSTSAAASPQSAPITAAALAAGPALGDSLSQALGSKEIAAFDSLGAPFWFNAAAFTVEVPGATVATRLQDFLHPSQWQPVPQTWQFHVQENAPATAYGHLALANGASRFTMAGPQGMAASLLQEPEHLQGLALSWNPPSMPMVSFSAGYIKEHESLLGSHGNGAFGQLSAETSFISAGLKGAAGRWSLSAVGEVGAVTPSVASSRLIDAISRLSTSAFRLQARRSLDNGNALSISLSQPLRVDNGTAAFSLPTGRTPDGVVTGASFSSPLAPSGRQLDVTTKLELPLAGGDLSLGVTRSSEPQHQRTAAPEWIFFTGYRAAW